MAVHEFECESCIHSYYVLVKISLLYERKTLNSTDRYAVAVLKDDVIIDHLPKGVITNMFFVYSKRWSHYLCCKWSTKIFSGSSTIRIKDSCKLQFSSSHKIATHSYNPNKFNVKKVLMEC